MQTSDWQLTMETVKFFGWLISSIVVSSATLIWVYLRLYIHDALQSHARAIQEITAQHYVRKDVHEMEIMRLEALIQNGYSPS